MFVLGMLHEKAQVAGFAEPEAIGLAQLDVEHGMTAKAPQGHLRHIDAWHN